VGLLCWGIVCQHHTHLCAFRCPPLAFRQPPVARARAICAASVSPALSRSSLQRSTLQAVDLISWLSKEWLDTKCDPENRPALLQKVKAAQAAIVQCLGNKALALSRMSERALASLLPRISPHTTPPSPLHNPPLLHGLGHLARITATSRAARAVLDCTHSWSSSPPPFQASMLKSFSRRPRFWRCGPKISRKEAR
jgi:hypothetical protein